MLIYILILLPAVIAVAAVVVLQRQRERYKPVSTAHKSSPLATSTEPVPAPIPVPAPVTLEADRIRQDKASSKAVMIVDDQAAIRMLLRELFELEGITVYEAPHGRTAIELIKLVHVDFILLDLKMPDMDGIEALRAIREIDQHVKAAMITAYGDPDKLDAAKQLGVLSSFTKPFDIEEVKRFVLSNLEK